MNIYPIPSSLKLREGRFVLKERMSVNASKEAQKAAGVLAKKFKTRCGITIMEAETENADIRLVYEAGEKESFRLTVSENIVEIGAGDQRGFVNAIEALLQMAETDGCIPCSELRDAPYKQFRGVHLYMPAPEYIDEYKRFLDVLSFLKFNTVIMEVGGTMELKKHPEVNRAWQAFCQTIVKKFPGGPQNFQWSDKYWKDSTHYENARGKILKQEEVRDLVQYAKDLGIQVIPEIQALSHCYYLTLAHREIAENQDDMFPDTYCPMNEESYKLYFEVAQEMLDVMEPEIVSIGHDEIRIMSECPRCKDKTGHEILAYEINRLHQFYAERNIRIMMWCETMLQPEAKYDLEHVGKEIDRVDAYGRAYKLPSMYKAINDIPKDVIMLDWYHSRSDNTEQCFTDRGFDVAFGNYSGIVFGNWDIRAERSMGAEISTWCTPDEFTMGRNGQLFDMIFSAQLFWNKGYNDSRYQEYLANAKHIAETVRKVMRGEKTASYASDTSAKKKQLHILYCAENGQYDMEAEGASCYGSNAAAVLEKCPKMSGVPIDTAHILLRTDFYADSLILCEGFKKAEKQYMSYSFINTDHWDESPMSDSSFLCTNMPRWSAATHEILYEDGTWEIVNATYGITAAAVNMVYDRDRLYLDEKVNEIDDEMEKSEGNRKFAPHFKLTDNWQTSVLYFSDTIVSGANTAYVYEWKNPHPEKKIVCIKCVSTTHDIEQSAVLFALGYKK